MDARARRHVPALLTAKVLLIVPEVAWNILGTLWAFSDTVQCSNEEGFTKAVIEAMVLFNWVQLALTLLGLALVFDPLGSSRLMANQFWDSNLFIKGNESSSSSEPNLESAYLEGTLASLGSES
ncbi:Sn1-specific diacylglycerol lipase beta [Gryllus bimaculatus]|nr:Sn1-specific diacylglycerol lipase beta [Gryllus bimaculatus]